jgi:hypothetical protein
VFRLSAVKQEPTETPSGVAGISGLLQAGEEVNIQQLGRELYTRPNTAGRPLDRLGAQLGKAVGAFNHTVSTMQSRVW